MLQAIIMLPALIVAQARIVVVLVISTLPHKPAPAIGDQRPVNQRMPDVPARCAAFPATA
ncbi:hypothetical protein P7L78_10160 [Tistrella bauzanensis]|uniref:hypothetical protein n=1 Tax=Tistrella TaxID=171436 RepID=UPI0031F6FE73